MALRKVLHGLSVYVDGIDHVGVAVSFTPPEITLEVEESNQPGHAGTIDIATGRVEKMEAMFTMADSVPELDSLVLNPAAPATPVLFVGVTTDGETPRTVEYDLSGLWTKQVQGEVGGGNETGRCTYTINPRVLTHRIDGAEVRHIDIEQSIHRVGGTDVLAQLRGLLRRGG